MATKRRQHKNIQTVFEQPGGSLMRAGKYILMSFSFVLVWVVWHNGVPGNVLPIKTVKVVGDLKWVKQAGLKTAMLDKLDAGFFNINVKSLKQSIEQMPWVRTASVRRIWPDRIELNIKEQQPVARWGERYLLNSDGLLFRPNSNNMPKDLPVLIGPEGQHQQLLRQYQELQSLLSETKLRIVVLNVSDRRAMELKLDNGIRLLFGRINETSDEHTAIERFVKAYKNGLAKRLAKIELIDLRYTNGFSVRWKT